MSQHVLNNFAQSSSTAPSTAPPTVPLMPSPADFNILATMLQDIAQVLLKYGMPEPTANADANADAEKSSQKKSLEQPEYMGQLEESSSREHLEQDDQLERLGESEEPSAKEQVVTFCYNTEGTEEKRNPAFRKIHTDIIEQHRRGEFHEEIRCFHVSASNVRKEYELLNKHNCVHLAEFLHQTHEELSMMVNLLSNIDRDIDLPASVLQRAGYNMLISLENISELHTHMENSQLVHTAIIPA